VTPRRPATRLLAAPLSGLLLALASGTAAGDCREVCCEATAASEPAERYAEELRALVERLCRRPANAALARRIDAARRGLPEAPGAVAARLRREIEAAEVTLLRVPGLLWKSRPGTGADLALLETLLERPVPLARTDELAPVEDNAQRVAERVRGQGRGRGRPVVLISASKGSAEVRTALEARPELGAHVAAWIDLVGVLEGTPLTDPDVPWGEVVADVLPGETARSLSRAVRARAVDPGRFPGSVRAVHVAAFPAPEAVSPEARPGFEALRPLGPNDGFVLLRPLLRAPGRVVPVRGVDHYLRVGALRERLAALLLVLLEEIAHADGAAARTDLTPAGRAPSAPAGRR